MVFNHPIICFFVSKSQAQFSPYNNNAWLRQCSYSQKCREPVKPEDYFVVDRPLLGPGHDSLSRPNLTTGFK